MQKKTMWVIEDDLNIHEVVAMFDEESGKVECYAYKGEHDDRDYCWCTAQKYERFFDTEGQAVDARNQFVREMKDMIPRVRKFVERMDYIEEDSEVFPHKKEDYLSDHAEDNIAFYMNSLLDEERITEALKLAFHQRLLNLNAQTVRIDDVACVKWCQYEDVDEGGSPTIIYAPTLVLKDGKEVCARKNHEYRMVRILFGDNNSGRVFNVPKPSDKP